MGNNAFSGGRFLVNKVSRQIKVQGTHYTVWRRKLNEYKEPARDNNGKYIIEQVGGLKEFSGIYHTSNSFVTEMVGEASRTTTKQQPMVLAIQSETNLLSFGDILVSDAGCCFEVHDVNDVSKIGAVVDISLEEVSRGLFF